MQKIGWYPSLVRSQKELARMSLSSSPRARPSFYTQQFAKRWKNFRKN
jgi:hypothetical protein